MSNSSAELNAEIDRIEAGIVLREARVRARVANLGQRVDAALPKAAAAGVVAAALGLLVLWLRPRRPVSPATAQAADTSTGWLHWVTMAWPLLPLSLRAMVDLRLITALGGPLLAWLQRRKRPKQAQAAPPAAADPADASRTHG
jgi:hypothetical protein